MSALRNTAFAAFAALAPAMASAATITSDEFAVSPAINQIDASGYQGSVNIKTSDADGDFSQTWTFEALEPLAATGAATTLNSDAFVSMSVFFNGSEVPVFFSYADTNIRSFPTLRLDTGDQFTVVVSFDSASNGGDFDFDIDTSPIPVPAGGLLLVSGMAGLGFLRRRARSA